MDLNLYFQKFVVQQSVSFALDNPAIIRRIFSKL